MIATKLLFIIALTRSVGIPKPVLRIEYSTHHGKIGDLAFETELEKLERKGLIKIKDHAVTEDKIVTITAAGKKALE